MATRKRKRNPWPTLTAEEVLSDAKLLKWARDRVARWHAGTLKADNALDALTSGNLKEWSARSLLRVMGEPGYGDNPGRRAAGGRHLFAELRRRFKTARGVRDPAALAAWVKRQVKGSNPPLRVELAAGGLLRLTHGAVTGYLFGANVIGVAHRITARTHVLYPVEGQDQAFAPRMVKDLRAIHPRGLIATGLPWSEAEAEDVLAAGAFPPGTNPLLAIAGNPPVHDVGGGHLSYESKASLLAPGPGAWQRIKYIGDMSPSQIRAGLAAESKRIQGEGAWDESGELWAAELEPAATAGITVMPPKPGAKSWWVPLKPGTKPQPWEREAMADTAGKWLKPVAIADMTAKQIQAELKALARKMGEGGAAPDTGEPWPNPGAHKWGPRAAYRSAGPFPTVAALHAAASALLARVHPESVMAAAARLALRSPDQVMARPVWQAALLDMLAQYPAGHVPGRFTRRRGNPSGAKPRGRTFGRQVEELKYRHVSQGARVHTFDKPGTKLEALADGSVRIFNRQHPVWGNL